MKIALINENSQAPKNALIFDVLKHVAEPLGYTCFNYGRYSAEDPHERTYVQSGFLAALLLNAKAADYVITGCGTGEGAMLACNSFPNVLCGLAEDPMTAYLFAQVNDGNALAIPFAKGFGWGGEINLTYIFERLFGCASGQGYPKEWAEAEHRNKDILDQVKQVSHQDFLHILDNLDREFMRGTMAEESFQQMFFQNCQVPEIAERVKEILAD
ncbi:MAG: RpiB/LacA/LacB family sugar-phosphate isomerase [Bacillota bacterium]